MPLAQGLRRYQGGKEPEDQLFDTYFRIPTGKLGYVTPKSHNSQPCLWHSRDTATR